MLALVLLSLVLSSAQPRRVPSARLFRSDAVDAFVANLTRRLADGDVAKMFERSFPNTLDTTTHFNASGGNLTFVVTGDIPAMWLRDSTNQVRAARGN